MGYLDARTAAVDLTKGIYGIFGIALLASLAMVAMVIAIPLFFIWLIYLIVKACFVQHYKGKARQAAPYAIPARAVYEEQCDADRVVLPCVACGKKLAVSADAQEVGCPECNEWTNFVRCPATGQTVRVASKLVVYKCPHCAARHPNPGYSKLSRIAA